MKPENRPKVKFDGKTYSEYEATQKQRQIETAIRHWKRRAAGAVSDDDKTAANIRIRRLNEEYKAFSKAAGLPEQLERMSVYHPIQRTPITEDSIKRVPLIRPNGISEESALKMQEAHKDLLRSIKDKPIGTEAGAIYSTDMRLIERSIGSTDQTMANPIDIPHIFMHNHPDNLTFSHTDIDSFIRRPDLILLTAVGNNGRVYALEKTDDYEAADFVKEYVKEKEILEYQDTPREYAQEMNRFLRRMSKCGVLFIRK